MFDFHQGVSDPDGEYDEGRIDDYSNDLLIAFNASDEAQLLSDRQNWSQLMLEYGFNHVGVSPAKMTRRDFEEVLFEIFPRKVSTGADQAESIIAELRAFWTFAARQFAARNAATILACLNDRAEERLRTELSNPANYGMAKSMFMIGSQSGFDMTSQEGLLAFQMAYNAKLQAGQIDPLPRGGLQVERSSPLTHDQMKQKRKDKKRQRENKKRNRLR